MNQTEGINEYINSSKNFNLKSTTWYSDLINEEKTRNIANWKEGNYPILIATSGFNCGIDYPKVRVVITVDECHDFVDLAQQYGRGGRDGGLCHAYLILYEDPKDSNFRHYISSNTCRRQILQSFLDGVGYPCILSDDVQYCDTCSKFQVTRGTGTSAKHIDMTSLSSSFSGEDTFSDNIDDILSAMDFPLNTQVFTSRFVLF